MRSGSLAQTAMLFRVGNKGEKKQAKKVLDPEKRMRYKALLTARKRRPALWKLNSGNEMGLA
jgi:hypothetical protein